jgi:hypothetical protein
LTEARVAGIPRRVDTLLRELGVSELTADTRLRVESSLGSVGLGVDPPLSEVGPDDLVVLYLAEHARADAGNGQPGGIEAAAETRPPEATAAGPNEAEPAPAESSEAGPPAGTADPAEAPPGPAEAPPVPGSPVEPRRREATLADELA